MQTMQAMIPCNVACLAIAVLFYVWRDLYVPRRREHTDKRVRVAELLFATAGHVHQPSQPSPSRPANSRDNERDELEDFEVNQQLHSSLQLYRDVECRACNGRHSFHCPSKTERKAGSTYSFVCPVVQKSAWIWWLGKPDSVSELPSDVVVLTWVSV